MSTNQNNGWSTDVPTLNPAYPPTVGFTPSASDITFSAALLAAAAQVVSIIVGLQVNVNGRPSVEATRAARILLNSFQPQVDQATCDANGVTHAIWQGTTDWILALQQVQAQIAAGF